MITNRTMCGIVGAIARRNVPDILLAGLQRLEYRGYDSAGVAVNSSERNQIQRRRAKGKVSELLEDIQVNPVSGNCGIAHTRWATHGKPSEANAHPHISNGRICLVHNGIIENHQELREELIKNGYEFSSETDSEVIVHLVDEFYSDQRSLLEAVKMALSRLKGAYAIGVIAQNEPDKIIAARRGSPLVVGVGIGENFLASDVLALSRVTDRFIYLEDGDLIELTTDRVNILDSNGNSIDRTISQIRNSNDDIHKGSYRHYMEKEIHSQPQVVRNTIEGRLGESYVFDTIMGFESPPILREAEGVTLVGCGTSYYAGLVAKYWIEELAGLPCNVDIASEFRYRKVVVPDNQLFVTLSQSGETADTLEALRIANQTGFLSSVAICNVATSSMVRESDLSILMEAGTEIGVASTKAFTAQLIDLLILALLLAQQGRSGKERVAEVVQALRGLDEIIESVLLLDSRLRSLAERFVDIDHALFLGRGPMYPIALEGALKLKEISYIHAEGYPAGELKHGPLALVDEAMPIVAVAPNNDLLEKVRSNLEEVRARGGQLFVFADTEAGFVEDEAVTVTNLPTVNDMLAPIVYAIPLQLLAYHTAVLKGTDVDQPRNLAKSVTVE